MRLSVWLCCLRHSCCIHLILIFSLAQFDPSVGVQEAIVQQHDEDSDEESAPYETHGRYAVSFVSTAGDIPHGDQDGVLRKHDDVEDESSVSCASFLQVEETEDVDGSHDAIKEDFLHTRRAKVCILPD